MSSRDGSAPGPIVIDAPRVEAADGGRIHATVDGHDLWFSTAHTRRLTVRGDPFVAAALLPAMRSGRAIHVAPSLAVSPQLLQNLASLQAIFRCWYTWATPIEIVAPTLETAPPAAGAYSLFSGGVDSSYTVLRNRGALDGILFVPGVDTGRVANSELVERVVANHRRVAQRSGLTLLVAGTNVKEFGHAYGVHWHQQVGAGLSAVAMANDIATLYFPSSSSWADLGPFGTHPVTDPLWQTESLQIIHDASDMRRVDKLAALGTDHALLDQLRVCMQGTEGNCGHCEKCLRTMAGLRALGLSSASVPTLTDLSALNGMDIRFEGILADWNELLDGKPSCPDAALAAAIRKLVRRWQIKHHLRALDVLFTGGRLRRTMRTIYPHRPQ